MRCFNLGMLGGTEEDLEHFTQNNRRSAAVRWGSFLGCTRDALVRITLLDTIVVDKLVLIYFKSLIL